VGRINLMNKIPKHLWKDVLLLTSKHGQRVYLLGTSHVSQKSCEITKELISHLKPAVVFIEICKERMPMILDMVENDKNQENHIDFHDTSIVESGSDLKTAFVTGLQFNSRIVLGDRLGRVTLQRVYHGHSLWQLYRAAMKYSFESAFELKSFFVLGTKKPFENIDFVNLIKDWSTDFPWIVECVVNEREKYMVLKLQEVW
jgi:pheromone shutdown protein TraB